MIHVHNVIKMKFVKEGYLPNWPYHLIADDEMCDAFLTYPWYDYRTVDEKKSGITLNESDIWKRFIKGTEPCYFRDNYPLYPEKHCGVGEQLVDEKYYRDLVEGIVYHINLLKHSKYDEYKLPDWIYSYMLGSTLGPKSSQLDLHSMFVMLETDNDFDEYLPDCAKKCLEVSTKWLKKNPELDNRPPTMFGEPHVLKSLRLDQLELL